MFREESVFDDSTCEQDDVPVRHVQINDVESQNTPHQLSLVVIQLVVNKPTEHAQGTGPLFERRRVSLFLTFFLTELEERFQPIPKVLGVFVMSTDISERQQEISDRSSKGVKKFIDFLRFLQDTMLVQLFCVVIDGRCHFFHGDVTEL